MPKLADYALSNYGLGGIPEKYATGEITGIAGSGMLGSYFKTGAATNGMIYVTVNYNFGFSPRMLIIRSNNPVDPSTIINTSYLRDFKNANGYSYCVSARGGGTYELSTSDRVVNGINFYVNESGFRLHVGQSSPPFPMTWEAWG